MRRNQFNEKKKLDQTAVVGTMKKLNNHDFNTCILINKPIQKLRCEGVELLLTLEIQKYLAT